jgi:SAM-dependent methyltransferase
VKQHWDRTYGKYREARVSWFEERPDVSLRLLRATGVTRDARLIGVGGGTSRQVDRLLEDGYTDVSVLDISDTAIKQTKSRLGQLEQKVQWLESDIRGFSPEQTWDVWHDRAVFHFLTDAEDRQSYSAALRDSLVPHGHIIIASFGLEGLPRCSGLQVVRYSSQSLHAELGLDLKLIESTERLHMAPSGAQQQFVYCRFRVP